MALSPNQVRQKKLERDQPDALAIEQFLDEALIQGGRTFTMRSCRVRTRPDVWESVLAKFRGAGWKVERKDDPSGREESWWEFS